MLKHILTVLNKKAFMSKFIIHSKVYLAVICLIILAAISVYIYTEIQRHNRQCMLYKLPDGFFIETENYYTIKPIYIDKNCMTNDTSSCSMFEE